MTEFDIQKKLFESFCKLNDISGIEFLTKDDKGNYTNVHFPNVRFNYPEDKRFFELTFKSNSPSDSSMGKDSQNRFTGVLYIDIITPQDSEEDEAENKYRWIARLFNGIELDYIDIMKVYVSNKGNEADHYRTLAAVEWEADIDKE